MGSVIVAGSKNEAKDRYCERFGALSEEDEDIREYSIDSIVVEEFYR